MVECGELIITEPFKANIHSLQAVEDSVFFDLLVPEYDEIERFCNFYEVVDKNSVKKHLKYYIGNPKYTT